MDVGSDTEGRIAYKFGGKMSFIMIKHLLGNMRTAQMSLGAMVLLTLSKIVAQTTRPYLRIQFKFGTPNSVFHTTS